jgi:acyl-CoA synthetase (AMP-forming)/AMP-acid ligase II
MLIPDYVDRGARIAPHAPCLVAPDGTVLLTHAEFEALTHRIAASLLADGVQPGDRIAVYSPNDPLAFACVVGIVRAGGIWTAVNAASATSELVDFLTMTGASRLLYHGSLADRAEAIIAGVPTIGAAVAIGEGRASDPQLEAWMAPEGARVAPQDFDTSRVMMLVGTGGTTGRPKGVPITHRQFHVMCTAYNAHLRDPEPPRYICATPMTHAAGASAFPVLAEGGSVIVHQGVVPADILDSIERNRVTRIFLPPTALYALLARPDVRERDFSSLRHFLVAAAPVAPERLAEAVDVFGPVMTQVFGQSEAPMMCTVFSPEEIAEAASVDALRHRLASCGRPSVVAQVELMDDEGRLLGPGEQGEVVVRSELVFGGYWQNPEATAEVRRPGGWHGTGDIGVRDEDGFVYIVDRKKDMIITGGFNVFPSEVEAVIHTFAEVNDCAVIGVPDEKWGEAVTAVIEPKPGAEIDGDAVIAACKERLGSVKTPKRVIVRSLPRSPIGKVLKRELRDEFWADAERHV